MNGGWSTSDTEGLGEMVHNAYEDISAFFCHEVHAPSRYQICMYFATIARPPGKFQNPPTDISSDCSASGHQFWDFTRGGCPANTQIFDLPQQKARQKAMHFWSFELEQQRKTCHGAVVNAVQTSSCQNIYRELRRVHFKPRSDGGQDPAGQPLNFLVQHTPR